MGRYQPSERVGVWGILDRLTQEVLMVGELGATAAKAMCDLLNTLEDQQNWRHEAALWPETVG
jgi:hypothetical protein